MILKLKRTPGIYLVGFMAAGKTTIGARLADELGWTFADLDRDIELAEGASIAELFDLRGEAEFRRIESAAMRNRVREIERGRPMVIALGGGAFVQPANCELLRENGVSIWLDCPLPLILARLAGASGRPLARDPAAFAQLYVERRPGYERADFRVEISDDDPAGVVARILRLPIF